VGAGYQNPPLRPAIGVSYEATTNNRSFGWGNREPVIVSSLWTHEMMSDTAQGPGLSRVYIYMYICIYP
jgi:hypothetical protein